ncbi:MAG: DMT family transporter [Phycisphaerae bacterium]
MQHVLALAVALVLNATANLLMKIGMKTVAEDGGVLRDGAFGAFRIVLGRWPLVIGLSCFVLNAGFYLYALQSKALKISVAYPIMVGGGFAMIAVVAYLHPALRETLTLMQKIGIGLVLAGIVLIAAESRGPGRVGGARAAVVDDGA